MKLSHKPVEKGFLVRLMSPLGNYPSDTFFANSAALVIALEICLSIVRVKGEDWSFSEVDSLTPPEIPLLGSILLSGEGGDPYIYPYPSGHVLLLQTASDEPLTDECISECRDFLMDSLKENRSARSPAELVHMPPALGGVPYNLITSGHSDSERHANLQRLETASPLLLRGVALLLKAHMAWQHPELAEAGCLFLWISLDAAHSLILQKLREDGMANPTSADAAKWFEGRSGYNVGWEKFFEDDYENRIRAIHPDNRFGAEARPQFLADDFLDLNHMLVPLFQHFLSG